MRPRTLVAATIAVAIMGAACTRQAPSPSSGQASAPIAVGDTAPVFALKSASGGTVSLSEFAGKPVLLYFSMGPG